MIFLETPLKGAYILELEKRQDERGFFARTFCQADFRAHSLNPDVAQCNISENRFKGTLRGMHFQKLPYSEVKLVRCISGGVFDVIIDLRPDSATYLDWFGINLTAQNGLALYVPENFAHGYLTLEDNSVVFYQVSEFYHPEAESILRWNDPAIGVDWPQKDGLILSEKDRNAPLLADQ